MKALFKYIPLITFLFTFSMLGFSQRKGDKKKESSDVNVRASEYYFTEAEKFYILEDYAKAMAFFLEALESDPGNSAAHYKISQIKTRNEEYSSALVNIDQAIHINPENKFYYLQKIDILTQMGNLEASTQTYEAMFEKTGESRTYLQELAALYLYSKNLQKALDTYNRMENRYGFDDNIAFQKHQIYSRLGNEDKALSELRRLHEYFPEEETFAVGLGEFLLTLGRDNEALRVLQEFSDLHSGSGKADILIGEIHRKNKAYNQAKPYLMKGFMNPGVESQIKVQLIAQYRTLPRNSEMDSMALELSKAMTFIHSDESRAYSVFGDYLQELGRVSQAAIQYEQAVRVDPNNFTLWQNLLLMNSSMGKFNKVLEIADQCLQYYPNQSIVYYLAGYAHVRIENYDEAIQLLKTGKRMVGDDRIANIDFNSLLGEAYFGLQQYRQSDESFEMVLTLEPDNEMVLNNYSYYLAKGKRNLEKAEEMSTQLIKRNPTNPNYLDTHAWVLYHRKKYREAKKFIEKAIENGGREAAHYNHYGDILYQLGKTDEAVEQWKKARSIDQSLENINEKIEDRRIYEN